MKFTCSSCQNPIQIDDAKVPAGSFKIKCPKCQKVISLSAPVSAPPAEASSEQEDASASPELQNFVKKEVAATKREILAAMQSLFGGDFKWQTEESPDRRSELGKKALICEDDQQFIDIIQPALKRLGFNAEIARSTAEAIKKVEQNFYDLITVDYVFPDDKEGGNKIIAKINGQKPVQRRQQFIVLISANIKSSDASAAFFHGANVTVNKDEIKNLEALIQEGQRHYQQIYNVFNRVLTDKNERI